MVAGSTPADPPLFLSIWGGGRSGKGLDWGSQKGFLGSFFRFWVFFFSQVEAFFLFFRPSPLSTPYIRLTIPSFSISASLAQLVARRSHNPKVTSSILVGSMFFVFFFRGLGCCGVWRGFWCVWFVLYFISRGGGWFDFLFHPNSH